MTRLAKVLVLVFFVLLTLGCTAEQSLVTVVKLSPNARNATEVNQRYGGLQLEYERTPTTFKSGIGEDRFVISSIVYYLKDSSGLKRLGKIDKVGVWNSSGKLIKKLSDIRMAGELAGISSSILTNPLGVSLVITTGAGGYKETNAAAILYVDISLMSIALFELEP